MHFADDFLFCAGVGSKSLSCQHLVSIFEDVCAKLGVPLAKEKSVGPTTEIVYLGLKIDSVKQTVSIPEEKVQAIIAKVENASKAQSLTLKEIQSLIGSLSFVCKAIAPGRPFIRRMIDLVKKSWHKIRLTLGVKSDLNMWLVFLKEYNGVSIFPDQFCVCAEDIQLFTDASGGVGFGGILQGKWFQGLWPVVVKDENRSIAWLELFPVIVAMVLWGRELKAKRIAVRSDNKGVVDILNKKTSKCPMIMRLVRFFVLQCLKHNVAFLSSHVPGKQNNIADALSRFQMDRFRRIAPKADKKAVPVPEFLWNL